MTTWDATTYTWDDASCGWDGGLGSVLQFITIESGDEQLIPVGSNYAPVVAKAWDGIGNPMPGIALRMFVNNIPGLAGGSFPDGTQYNYQTTDLNGLATFDPVTANTLPGRVFCSLTANLAGVDDVNFYLNQATTDPALVQIVSGSPQSTRVTFPYPQQLSVRVLDAFGNPLPDVDVEFRAPPGYQGVPTATFPGGLLVVVANTGPDSGPGGPIDPVATVAAPTANTVAGPVAVVVTVVGSGAQRATFGLTNLAGPAVLVLAVSGTPQSAPGVEFFGAPMVATGADAYGNPVANQTVTFTAPLPSPSGAFADGSKVAVVLADDTGRATAPGFRADGVVGTYRVIATLAGSPAEGVFLLTNTLVRDPVFGDSDWEFVSPSGEGIRLRVLRGGHGRLMPAVELWEEEVPGEPGYRFLGARHAQREINLPCLIESPVVGLPALRQIARVLDPTQGIGSLRVRLVDGEVRQIGATYAGGLDATREETPSALWAPLVFRTPDPYWTDGITQTVQSAAGNPAVEVVNDGDYEAWPIITCLCLVPDLTIAQLRLVNTETGHKIELRPSAGANNYTANRIVIDCRPGHKSVLLDGVNIYRALTVDSDLFPLAVGSQVINIASANPAVLFNTIIEWPRRFLSI